MKKTFYILAFIYILGFNYLKAQSSVATLDHFGTTTVFYGSNALVDAYNASVNGDAIVLSSGYFNAPNPIQKGIYIIGVGHYPDSSNNTTYLPSILLGLGANGVTIEGIKTNSISNNDTINVVTIKRCFIANGLLFGISANNVTIESSIFTTINFSNKDNNVCIRNNILITTISSPVQNISNGALIENNIFCYNYNAYPNEEIFIRVYGAVIRNNILYRKDNDSHRGIFHSECGGNLVQHNFIHNADAGNIDSVSNIFTNNYWGTFINIFQNDLGTAFDYNMDYHILNPIQYIGTDGTQIGIYGGTNPYKENAVPSNPRIISKYIAPQNDSNGNLQINIKAKVQY